MNEEMQRYFQRMYANDPDPYLVKTRWYEQRKRNLILTSLPHRMYFHAFEPGCGTGELSVHLAERCHRVLISDSNSDALATARHQTKALPNVLSELQSVPEQWPESIFDLIVLSEVTYFLDAEELQQLIIHCCNTLTRDGTLVVCNWKPDFAERRLDTATISTAFCTIKDLHCIARHEENDFLLELFSFNPMSVAQLEKII